MPNDAYWYVARTGEQAGPFTDEQLRAYATNGDLKPDDQVWRPGFESWRRASDVPGLLRPPIVPLGPPSPPEGVPTAAVATHLARSNEGKTSKGDVISIPKTAGILIALSTLCVIFLALTTRHFDDGPAYPPSLLGYENSVSSKLGRAVGGAIFIFVLGAIGAGIARLVTLKARGDRRYFAPVIGGAIVALILTALVWTGATARRTSTAPPEKPIDRTNGFSVSYVDPTNGFSVRYNDNWVPSQPNEEVTKLLIVSPEGNRCWVIACRTH